MMKSLSALVACLALAGPVLADGVPLITAGKALPANDTARQLPMAQRADFVKLHPIVLNQNAFGANVLTVELEGKTYRFVGSLMPAKPPAPKAVTEKQTNTRGWSGTEPGGGTLVLMKNLDTGAIGGAELFLRPARTFHLATPLRGSTVLIEVDSNAPRPPITIYRGDLPASAVGSGK